jgi:hypothetical protein
MCSCDRGRQRRWLWWNAGDMMLLDYSILTICTGKVFSHGRVSSKLNLILLNLLFAKTMWCDVLMLTRILAASVELFKHVGAYEI